MAYYSQLIELISCFSFVYTNIHIHTFLIIKHEFQAIVEQLDILSKRYKEKNDVNREDFISELEEYGFLVSALAEFFETTMRPLLIGCVEKRNGEVLRYTHINLYRL